MISRLKAVIAAADRAGFKPGVEIDMTAKPFESIFEQMETGVTRAEHRRSLGIEDDSVAESLDHDPPALAIESEAESNVIDVDVLDDDARPFTPEDQLREAGDDSEQGTNLFAPTQPPAPDGLMSLDAAVSAATAMRRDAGRVHRAQRALPRSAVTKDVVAERS